MRSYDSWKAHNPADEELGDPSVYEGQPLVDQDCEDQALCPTKHCTICRPDFDSNNRPIYVPLVKRGRFWCCRDCGASYGERPHPELT